MYDYKLLQVSCENFAFDMFDRILESLTIVLLIPKLCYLRCAPGRMFSGGVLSSHGRTPPHLVQHVCIRTALDDVPASGMRVLVAQTETRCHNAVQKTSHLAASYES